MMVSKIAVIALVAIISVPILLGYAMNLNEVTVTDYETTGDSVNVTPLLKTGTQYNYVDADLNSLNTHFKQGTGSKAIVEPHYNHITSTRTSKSIFQYNYTAGSYDSALIQCSSYDYYYQQSNYSGSGGHLNLTMYNPDNSFMGFRENVHSYYWNKASMTLEVTYYYPSNQYVALSSQVYSIWSENCKFQASDSGGYNSTGFIQLSDPLTFNYVDFSRGYTISGLYQTSDNSILNNNAVFVNLPDYSRNMMMTVDLNSITASNYTFIISVDDNVYWSYLGLVKTTDGSGVHWGLYKSHIIGYNVVFDDLVADLYYDSSRSSNAYQIMITTTGGEARYVGNWPTVIGAANYYQSYTFEWDNITYGSLVNVSVSSDSPTMRIDSAEYRGFESPIIENQTYIPSDFKTNPATKIENIYTYGTSIVFGGITYAVTDKKIMIGTHKIPVNDIVFDSIPNENGNYDNRINGTKVSESVSPATIRFNGQWSASVSTTAQDSYTYTKTEWVAGHFGWDGIDHNFLIVGLITSFGAFIALGIYMRRTKASLWPLLIVCGGAAVLFFVML